MVNPLVLVTARGLGLKGTESFQEIAGNIPLLDQLNSIRDQATVAVGMAETPQEAKVSSPAVPKIAFVAEPQDYITTSGIIVKKEEIDILAKMFSMERLHRTFAGSALYGLASATLLPGTVAHELAVFKGSVKEQILRIGHPDGIAEVRVALTADGNDIAYVGMDRTARRIMKGDLFIPQ